MSGSACELQFNLQSALLCGCRTASLATLGRKQRSRGALSVNAPAPSSGSEAQLHCDWLSWITGATDEQRFVASLCLNSTFLSRQSDFNRPAGCGVHLNPLARCWNWSVVTTKRAVSSDLDKWKEQQRNVGNRIKEPRPRSNSGTFNVCLFPSLILQLFFFFLI